MASKMELGELKQWISISKLEKELRSRIGEVPPNFEQCLTKVFKIIIRLAQDSRWLASVNDPAPIELQMIVLLVFKYAKQLSSAQLSKAIGGMRRYIRAPKFKETIKNKTGVMKNALDYIMKLDVSSLPGDGNGNISAIRELDHEIPDVTDWEKKSKLGQNKRRRSHQSDDEEDESPPVKVAKGPKAKNQGLVKHTGPNMSTPVCQGTKARNAIPTTNGVGPSKFTAKSPEETKRSTRSTSKPAVESRPSNIVANVARPGNAVNPGLPSVSSTGSSAIAQNQNPVANRLPSVDLNGIRFKTYTSMRITQATPSLSHPLAPGPSTMTGAVRVEPSSRADETKPRQQLIQSAPTRDPRRRPQPRIQTTRQLSPTQAAPTRDPRLRTRCASSNQARALPTRHELGAARSQPFLPPPPQSFPVLSRPDPPNWSLQRT